MLEEQRKWARQEVSNLAARLAKRGVKCNVLLEHGAPQERIVETAKRVKADLILMSTHGRTGLSHLMLGSVAERVVRTAPCAVLIVPHAARRPTRGRRNRRKAPSRRASSNGRGPRVHTAR
jgi:nucleotide-binding universal stress UspA family protein